MGDFERKQKLIKRMEDKLWFEYNLCFESPYLKLGLVVADIVMDYVDAKFAELEKNNGH